MVRVQDMEMRCRQSGITIPPDLIGPYSRKYSKYEKPILKVDFNLESESKVIEGRFGPQFSWTQTLM